MSAAVAKPTEHEYLVRRLKDAAYDLSRAADQAMEAVEALDPNDTIDTGAGRADLALAELVCAMHEAEHDGPSRWCRHEVCVKAEELLS
jgi:hypothetical protein